MWKHEILSSLKSLPGNKDFVNLIQESVLKSQQFFIDDMVSVRESLKGAIINGAELNFKQYPMPYPNTLLCYTVHHFKGASLYCEYPNTHRNIAMIIDLKTNPDNNTEWFVLPMYLGVAEDGSCQMYKINTGFDDIVDRNDLSHCGSRLVILSLLSSCKNITPFTIEPPPKVNKKRNKKGKVPLYSYHVLTIKSPQLYQNRKSDNRNSLLHNRLHFQRGHFKEYLSKNPLFGKFIGRYWWQPHLRGKNLNGFIDKDYRVKTEVAAMNDV